MIQLPWLRYVDAYLSFNAFIPPIIYLCLDFIATIIHIPKTEESGDCHLCDIMYLVVMIITMMSKCMSGEDCKLLRTSIYWHS